MTNKEASPATIFSELETILGSLKASDIASMIVAFKTHDIVGEIQGCETLIEAVLKVVAIFIPGVAAAELGVELTAFIAIAILGLKDSPFTIALVIPDVTTNTENNIEDQFGPSHGGRGY